MAMARSSARISDIVIKTPFPEIELSDVGQGRIWSPSGEMLRRAGGETRVTWDDRSAKWARPRPQRQVESTATFRAVGAEDST